MWPGHQFILYWKCGDTDVGYVGWGSVGRWVVLDSVGRVSCLVDGLFEHYVRSVEGLLGFGCFYMFCISWWFAFWFGICFFLTVMFYISVVCWNWSVFRLWYVVILYLMAGWLDFLLNVLLRFIFLISSFFYFGFLLLVFL